MVHGHPETLLLHKYGERGFVFCGPRKIALAMTRVRNTTKE